VFEGDREATIMRRPSPAVAPCGDKKNKYVYIHKYIHTYTNNCTIIGYSDIIQTYGKPPIYFGLFLPLSGR
jgi:hypothetical protein